MDRNERWRQLNDRSFVFFVHFGSSHLSDIFKFLFLFFFGPHLSVTILQCHCLTFQYLNPVFIPWTNSVHSYCGTFTGSDWYYLLYLPSRGTLLSLSFSKKKKGGWPHGGCTCLCKCPSGIWNICTYNWDMVTHISGHRQEFSKQASFQKKEI